MVVVAAALAAKLRRFDFVALLLQLLQQLYGTFTFFVGFDCDSDVVDGTNTISERVMALSLINSFTFDPCAVVDVNNNLTIIFAPS